MEGKRNTKDIGAEKGAAKQKSKSTKVREKGRKLSEERAE